MINKILFYNSGGGIGDAIQILPLINTLRNELKNTKFYYLCAHENHFNTTLKDYDCKINTLDLNIKYFGFRWWHPFFVRKELKKHNIEKFELIIDLQSKIRNSLILKIIPHDFFISTCINFKLCKPNIDIKKDKKLNNTILNAFNCIFKENYKLSRYDINKINKKIFNESVTLLPKNNYVGFSITQGNVYRKKEWPLNNIVKLCEKLKENNKTPVFFIEKKNSDLKNKIKKLLPFALFPEHDTNTTSPALVTCLGKRLDFALSIDNGIMHMLSLGEIPMIVLFGPTNSEKFAPENKNIFVLDSKKLYNSTDISSISVEDVLRTIKQNLSF